MSDPALKNRPGTKKSRVRTGAVMPLAALIFPVLILFAGFAINVAWMQLLSTELKIATDAASHAGGRAMSLEQTTEAAIREAERMVQLNHVGGRAMEIADPNSPDNNSNALIAMDFGISTRPNNGRFQFTDVPRKAVDDGSQRATSFLVSAQLSMPMIFQVTGLGDTFQASRRSIATQVDRDIALVLDRSGSMLFYQDEDDLDDVLDWLHTNERPVLVQVREYRHWKWVWTSRFKGFWQHRGYLSLAAAADEGGFWDYDRWDYRTGSEYQDQPYITQAEFDNASKSFNVRSFSNNVIYQIEANFNNAHTLGNFFHSSESHELVAPMAQYAADWQYARSSAPRYSSWWFVEQGVETFLQVLESTAQDEQVSLVTFNLGATLDEVLLSSYQPIRDRVLDTYPGGGTAIGLGLETGLPPIITGAGARPFAAKTIIVLTDGVSSSNTKDPIDAVKDIVGDNDVTIHTMTFTAGADKTTMQEVARIGHGRAYHADDGADLVRDFNEIANNLPTILTE